MEFPNVKRLGLQFFQPFGDETRNEVIYARDLEWLLEKAERVEKYASIGGWRREGDFNPSRSAPITFTALVICAEPVKPKTLGEKIQEILDDHSLTSGGALCAIRDLLDQQKAKA